MLIIFAITSIRIYWIVGKLIKVNSEYQAIRENIIKLTDTEFCNCHAICGCKEQYLMYMDGKGINLIF